MFVYSKSIISFLQSIKRAIKTIITEEVGLKVSGRYFFDRRRHSAYPIKVVIFNNKSVLGYFDSQFYELGFHESLMRTHQEQLYNVIRHEIAHYLTFIEYGDRVLPHAEEFRSVCQRLGWGESVFRATICLEECALISPREESSVLRKVKKLMALASSSNQNEAELAMIKSHELLLKHNIDTSRISELDEEQMVLKRIRKQKRENAKMRAIARILETFFVSCVFNRIREHTFLEILGTAVNVEIADYVASFLDVELDKLWEQAKDEAGLKGMVAKNSFFLGIAKGYCTKIKAFKKDYDSTTTHALLIIEKQLTDAKAMAYGRLSYSRSSASHCRESSQLGEKVGSALNINPALGAPKKSFFTRLLISSK